MGTGGLEPPWISPHDPKSCAYTNSATSPIEGELYVNSCTLAIPKLISPEFAQKPQHHLNFYHIFRCYLFHIAAIKKIADSSMTRNLLLTPLDKIRDVSMIHYAGYCFTNRQSFFYIFTYQLKVTTLKLYGELTTFIRSYATRSLVCQ